MHSFAYKSQKTFVNKLGTHFTQRCFNQIQHLPPLTTKLHVIRETRETNQSMWQFPPLVNGVALPPVLPTISPPYLNYYHQFLSFDEWSPSET